MTFARGLAGGVGLLVLALFCWFLHVVSASNAHHSWDSGGPTGTVTLRAGHLYHLSTTGGTGSLPTTSEGTSEDAAALACTYSTASDQNIDLTADRITTDARVLHRIATFVAPTDGPLSITCAGVGALYVDDATSSAFDRAGAYVILTCLLGSAGSVLCVGALMRRASEVPEPWAG